MLFIVAGTVNISQMFATITSALTLTVAHSMHVKSLSPMKEGGDSSSVPAISIMRCLTFSGAFLGSRSHSGSVGIPRLSTCTILQDVTLMAEGPRSVKLKGCRDQEWLTKQSQPYYELATTEDETRLTPVVVCPAPRRLNRCRLAQRGGWWKKIEDRA